MVGFTFMYGRKDVFIETSRVNKTETLASKIIKGLVNEGYDVPDNPDVRRELLWYLRRATCELRILPNGNSYWEISGDNFGGRGSFVGDGKTIIIKLAD